MTSREDRFAGCLLGLAVGDALGASVEFMSPGTFEPVSGMRGGGGQLPVSHYESQQPAEPVMFQVFIDDNYHFMDESARHSGGAFDTYDEALAKAKMIVRASVKECAEGKDSAGEILGCYKMFGDDAWIDPTPDGVEKFSAWEFARTVAEELVTD